MIASVGSVAGKTTGLVALPFLLQHRLGATLVAAGLVITLWPMRGGAAVDERTPQTGG